MNIAPDLQVNAFHVLCVCFTQNVSSLKKVFTFLDHTCLISEHVIELYTQYVEKDKDM
jgi:hypothetical protein